MNRPDVVVPKNNQSLHSLGKHAVRGLRGVPARGLQNYATISHRSARNTPKHSCSPLVRGEVCRDYATISLRSAPTAYISFPTESAQYRQNQQHYLLLLALHFHVSFRDTAQHQSPTQPFSNFFFEEIKRINFQIFSIILYASQ